MAGRLRLVVGLDGAGRAAALRQYSSSLCRLLRMIPGEAPEEGIFYLVNPTGGILQGDRLDSSIRVESGAHAIVTAPSATKVYRMPAGRAVSRTTIRVVQGATLEYLPELLIPHGGSRFVESLQVDVDAGGKILLWEMVAPGRLAGGESMAYKTLELRLEFREAGKLVLRERASLAPGRRFPPDPVGFGGFSYYGVLLAAGGEPERTLEHLRQCAGRSGGVFAGATRLEGSAVMLKALAQSSAGLGNLFRAARDSIMPLLAGRPASLLRRT